MSRIVVLAALVGLLVAQPVAAQTRAVSVTPDVVFGHKNGMALTFDVFTPANANGAAVLNMVSGGWRSRWLPHEESQQRYQALLDAGFTVLAVRHGSSPKYTIPEIVPDVRRAVRYVRLNADRLGVDPNRLGVWGGSAGGHLSLMLGNASDNGDLSSEDAVLRESDRVAAVVAYYPPTDLRPAARAASPNVTNARYPALEMDSSEVVAYSPIVHVSTDDPPTLLIHGDSDTLVDVSNSRDLYAEFQEHGVESTLMIIPGSDHGFRGEDAAMATAAMVDWFAEHIGSRSSN